MEKEEGSSLFGANYLNSTFSLQLGAKDFSHIWFGGTLVLVPDDTWGKYVWCKIHITRLVNESCKIRHLLAKLSLRMILVLLSQSLL